MLSQDRQPTNDAIRAASTKWNAAEASINKKPISQRLKDLGFVPGQGINPFRKGEESQMPILIHFIQVLQLQQSSCGI